MKYFQPIVFGFLLILTVFAPLIMSFSVIPGWYATIFPITYSVQTRISILTLLFAVIGYIILTKKFSKSNYGLFIVHFLLTIPTIIISIFPIEYAGFSSSIDDIKKRVQQIHFIERLSFNGFIVGQIIFAAYFFYKMKLKRN
jgi:tellurite resistance protein TehA-like permease